MTQEEIDAIPSELVIPLPKPIEFEGKTWDKLELREPTVGEMEKISSFSGPDAGRKGLSLMTQIPERALEKLPTRAFIKAQDYLMSFMESARQTST